MAQADIVSILSVIIVFGLLMTACLYTNLLTPCDVSHKAINAIKSYLLTIFPCVMLSFSMVCASLVMVLSVGFFWASLFPFS